MAKLSARMSEEGKEAVRKIHKRRKKDTRRDTARGEKGEKKTKSSALHYYFLVKGWGSAADAHEVTKRRR